MTTGDDVFDGIGLAQWQLITTFNEYGEGTAIEASYNWINKDVGFGVGGTTISTSQYGYYLDCLHEIY